MRAQNRNDVASVRGARDDSVVATKSTRVIKSEAADGWKAAIYDASAEKGEEEIRGAPLARSRARAVPVSK